VRERMKTCLFRRFRASSSDVFVERIERGFREKMSNVGSGREEVVGGKSDVRNDPMDAITVSDYISAFSDDEKGRRKLTGPMQRARNIP
jgi:hypothetical protein